METLTMINEIFGTRGLKLAVLLAGLLGAGMVFAGEITWIDVRTDQEYASGHVEQAVNIPYQDIAQGIATLGVGRNDTIYVYCRSGRRSGIAKQTLEGLGYTQVVNVGGLDAALSQAARAAAGH